MRKNVHRKTKHSVTAQTGRHWGMGINFDTKDLTWNLPEDKRIEYGNLIHEALSEAELSLVDSQTLVGKLTFVCSMAPWARTFLRPLQIFQTSLEESSMKSGILPGRSKERSGILVGLHNQPGNNPHPNCTPHRAPPPLQYKTFTTDAAGWNNNNNLKIPLLCFTAQSLTLRCVS